MPLQFANLTSSIGGFGLRLWPEAASFELVGSYFTTGTFTENGAVPAGMMVPWRKTYLEGIRGVRIGEATRRVLRIVFRPG